MALLGGLTSKIKEFLGLPDDTKRPDKKETFVFKIGEGLTPAQAKTARIKIKRLADTTPKFNQRKNPFSFAKELLLEYPVRAEEPVYSLSERKERAEETLADLGVEKKWSAPLSKSGVAAMTAFDIIPEIPDEKKVLEKSAEKLAKELLERQVAKGVAREEAIINARIAKDLFIESGGKIFPKVERELALERETEKARQRAEKLASPLGLTKEIIKGLPSAAVKVRKGIGGGVKTIGRYLGEAAAHPVQTGAAAFEEAIFKPTIGATKLLGLKKLAKKEKEGLKAFKEQFVPTKEAEVVGEFLGWMLPLTAAEKVIGAVPKLQKLGKLAPIVKELGAWLATNQLLYDPETDGSRAKQALEDLAAFGVLKGAGKLFRLAKGKLAVRVADEVVKPVEQAMKRGEKVALEEVETAVKKVKRIIKAGTGKEPKQIVKEEIVPKLAEKEAGEIVKQEFNFGKLNLNKEQEKEISKRLAVLGLEKRKVRTFGDMMRAAQDLGVEPKKLLREITNNRINDAEVVALRDLIKDNSDYIVKADKLIRLNPIKAAEIEAKKVAAQNQIDTALSKLVKGGTEAGRAVVSFRIIANRTLEPEFWYLQAKKQLNLKPFTSEMKTAIDDLIAKKDRAGLANFVALLRKPGWDEKAITLWKAGLLSAPPTHMANIGGNTTIAGLETAKDVPATMADVLASMITGKRTKAVSLGGFKEQAKGLFQTGPKRAYRYFKTGVDPESLLLKYDIPKKVSFDNPVLQGYTNFIFRTLAAEDLLFREKALRGSLFEQALVQAKNEGLSGKTLKNRVKELFLNPTDKMTRIAIDDASYATFQKENVLAKAAAAAKGTSKGMRAIGEILAPFTRTPPNIAEVIVDYSPIGFLKEITSQLVKKDFNQKRLVESFGRSITGTGIITIGYLLAEKGLMSGNKPKSEKEKAQWQLEGKQDNSILYRGKWRKLSRVSPLGNLLLMGAAFNQAVKDEKKGLELFATTTGETIKSLTEQTFLKGVSGGLKAITEPEKYADYFAESTIGSIVPSLVGRIAHIVDPAVRETKGVPFGIIQSRIPVLSEKLLPKRNSFGEIIKYEGGIVGGLLDPFYSRSVNNDPVVVALRNDGLMVGLPSRYLTIKGERRKLTPLEYDKYLEMSGKKIKKRLNNWVLRGNYKRLPSDKKQAKIDSIVSEERKKARSKIFGKGKRIRRNPFNF